MSPQPARKALQQRVAAAILEGAARTLAADGAEASMSDVASATGVARATVYRYFPNRQALLDELAHLALSESAERLASARLDEVPAQEGIARMVGAMVDVGDAFVVLARERARREDFGRTIALPLTLLLERAQAAGEIRDDVPLPWLCEALVGLVVSVVAARPSRGREDTIAAITSMFLDGASHREPRLP